MTRRANWRRSIALMAAVGLVALSLACLPARAWAAGKSSKSITTHNALSYAIRHGGSRTVTLDGDIELTSTLTIAEEVTIDLNGYVLSAASSARGAIRITTGEVTLTDSNPSRQHADPSLPEGGVLAGDYVGINGAGVWCSGSGKFTLAGGTIYGFEACGRGGGVRVASGGTFNMTGGTISNCGLFEAHKDGSTTCNGAVYVADGGTFNKSGGTIADCEAVVIDDNLKHAEGDYLEDAEDEPDVSTPVVVPPALVDGNS